MQSFKRLIMCIVFLLLSISSVGCTSNVPPTKDDVEAVFHQNILNINVVVSFLTASEYTNIYISDDDRTMTADLETQLINDGEVNAAIKQLLGTGTYKTISKRDNTIIFLQWTAPVKDIGCGITYTKSDTDNPDITYLTQLQPLNETNWYYYVEDYEQYRSNCSTWDGLCVLLFPPMKVR